MMADTEKQKCEPCCHNGHGVKKSPVKARVDGQTIYRCWLESCGKTVAWYDDGWQFDPCAHILRESNGEIVFF